MVCFAGAVSYIVQFNPQYFAELDDAFSTATSRASLQHKLNISFLRWATFSLHYDVASSPIVLSWDSSGKGRVYILLLSSGNHPGYHSHVERRGRRSNLPMTMFDYSFAFPVIMKKTVCLDIVITTTAAVVSLVSDTERGTARFP